jgi:regulatory protein
MPTITSLEIQKKNKDRANVFVDDEFFCGLTLDDVVKFKLHAGLVLSESELADLRASAAANDLFNKALVYLLKSPKTSKQIRDYLYKKDASREEVTAILARLESLGYLNDADYATRFTEAKSQKSGVRVIRQKLLAKGISRETAEEVTAEIGDQSELAQTLAEKYMRNKTRTQKERASLNRFLLSKGFDYETVARAVREIFNCETEE